MEYLITGIKKVSDKKSVVYINYNNTLPLYNSEIRRYQLVEGEVISSLVYEEIINDIIIKRAKRRALYILKNLDKSEQQLRQKLKEGYYSIAVIDIVIDYVKGYKYIDDDRVAENFIRCKQNCKSKKELQYLLKQKGIDIKKLDSAIYDTVDETETIKQLLRKRNFNAKTATEEELRKTYMYLERKGFQHCTISTVLNLT
ncbi:MAG: regulatory protein RecX [Lachnospira sp.]|nr:regulatory protein RecX [Lachnospira sp.]